MFLFSQPLQMATITSFVVILLKLNNLSDSSLFHFALFYLFFTGCYNTRSQVSIIVKRFWTAGKQRCKKLHCHFCIQFWKLQLYGWHCLTNVNKESMPFYYYCLILLWYTRRRTFLSTHIFQELFPTETT